MTGQPPRTVRAASTTDSLINDMRALVQSTEATVTPVQSIELERTVSTRVTTILMLLLLMLVFVTSAVPDIGPSMAAAFQAHI